MGTLELGNGEICPYDGCHFVLGEDYDGDSFKHIIDKHPDEVMHKLFKPITLLQALETVRLILKYHTIEGENMIIHIGTLGPLQDLDRFLTSMYNHEVIKDNDISIANKTPEPQGENNEEDED